MSIKIPEGLRKTVSYNPQPQIPQIIHQTYKTSNLPPAWKETPRSWMENHENWSYMFWDDTDCRELVAEHFPDFLSIFDAYEYPIQRADAVRYMMMYVYGGIYVDMDMACKKPIDDLFYKRSDVYLLRTPNTGIITNCFMASKAGSNFWLHVIQMMIERAKDPSTLWVTKHVEIMNTTGPAMLQAAYDDYISTGNPRVTFTFLPRPYLFPDECNVCAPKPCTTADSYVTILQGSSWCGGDTEIMTTFYCHYREVIVILMLGLILISINYFMPSTI
jgi:inositol phosphorylceramide mannosyltransferase catalytic subunit